MENESLIPNGNNDRAMKGQDVTKGWFKKRYVFAFLASLGFVNVYAMRINLSISLVAMVNNSAIESPNKSLECVDSINITNTEDVHDGEFVWDKYTQSLILGSFFWGYIVTQLPAGRMAEIVGGKWIFGIGVLWTAILTLLTPVAAYAGQWYLIVLRVLEGFGEGVTFPAMHIMISRWSPPHERSRTVTFIQAGSLLGTVIGLPLSGYLIIHGFAGGWPSVFYVFGAAGIVWFIFWSIFVFDSPQKHPWIDPEEKEYIIKSLGYTNELNQKSPPFPWRKAFKSLPVWAIIIAHFCNNWGFYTLLTELPTYLDNVLHFDMNKNSFLSALPYFLSWIFGLFISTLCDNLIKKNYLTTTVARKIFHSIGQILPGVFLLAITQVGCDQWLTFSFLVIAMASSGATYGGYSSNHIDIAPNFAGTLLGITNSIATIPGWMGPYVVGVFTQGNSGKKQWNNVFYLSSALYFVSALAFTILSRGEEQPWNKTLTPDEETDKDDKNKKKQRLPIDLRKLVL